MGFNILNLIRKVLNLILVAHVEEKKNTQKDQVLPRIPFCSILHFSFQHFAARKLVKILRIPGSDCLHVRREYQEAHH